MNQDPDQDEPRPLSTLRDFFAVINPLLAAAQGDHVCEIHERCDDAACPGRDIVYEANRAPDGQIVVEKRTRTATVDPPSRPGDGKRPAELGNYAYEALSDRKIRLLNIKPADLVADVVECEMVTVSLDKAGDFNALSYCWGSSTFDSQIICNGRKLAVTESLERTLKVYRRSLDVFGKRPLWVDAVSVNQSDTAERTEQVLLMQSIYGTAASVVVDLGDADLTWSLGFDVMTRLSRAHQLADGYRPQPKAFYDEIFDTLPHPDTPAWTYYMDILSAPWFRRTWILQEIALARNAMVRYGRYIFPWDIFLDAFTFFTKSNWHLRLSSRASSTRVMPGLISVFSILDICRVAQETEEQPSSMLSLLQKSRNQEVTDTRDKVIGVLGMIRNGPTRDNTSYIANYSFPVTEVYHRLAVHLVRGGGGLDMLPHAGLQRRAVVHDVAALPSWAPDWAAQVRACGPPPLALFRPSSYSAATAAEPHIKLEQEAGRGQPYDDSVPPRVLSVVGWCIDTIKHLSDAHPLFAPPEVTKDAEIQRRFLAWHASVRRCLDEARSQTPIHSRSDIDDDAAAADALARTLLVNDLYTGSNQTSGSAPITDPAASLARVINNLEHSKVDPSGTVTNGEDLKHTNYDGTADSTYAQQAFAAAPGRRFAVTAGGCWA
jgi:hypothetical protein